MSDWTVADMAADYRAGRLTRRHFIARILSAGLGAPVIASVLAACGSSAKPGPGGAAPQAGAGTSPGTKDTFQPTKRGGGGTLKLLWWQAPTILNRHLSSGVKDNDASRLFTEPLAAWDPNANLIPTLAAELPSVDKGTLDKDGKSVTWKLKPGVQWHDGQPFSADDVIFTWQYIVDPATAATSAGSYQNIDMVEKIDDATVKITFKEPTPLWHAAFTGNDHVFPKHVLEAYKGQNARNAPFNLKPVGTGPYKIVDFRPGDVTIAEINQNYHVPNRPFFDRVELKGGGDATSAARAVLQTGDYDYGWNMQVADDLLLSLEKGSNGRTAIFPGSGTESIHLNLTDPNVEVDGERSSIKTKHPFFSDLKVRQAFALAINRKAVAEQLYGRQGAAATYVVFNPKKFMPDGTFEYNLQKAAQMLDAAGWKKGPDGIRSKDGKKMKVLYQTSVNDVRQNTQAIVKKDLESLGIQVELKSVNADVYFGGDPGNPDNTNHFYADMQMYNILLPPDPQSYLSRWSTTRSGTPGDNIAQKSNGWSAANVTRYQNPEYDKTWLQARTELDPIKRADLLKKLVQTIFEEAPSIPVVNRFGVSVAKNNLGGIDPGPFDSDLWNLSYWYRKA